MKQGIDSNAAIEKVEELETKNFEAPSPGEKESGFSNDGESNKNPAIDGMLDHDEEKQTEQEGLIMTTCKNCGAQIDDGAMFCSECGAKVESPAQASPADDVKIFCHNCGNEMRKDARFCTKCGSPVAADASVPTQAAVAGNVPIVYQSVLQQPNRQMGAMINQSQEEVLNLDFSGLDPYYQNEFKKIYESGETYKGSFNPYSFFFTWIWLLVKGMTMPAIVHALACSIAALPTLGVSAIGSWVICATRGTWIYYNSYVKHKDVFY